MLGTANLGNPDPIDRGRIELEAEMLTDRGHPWEMAASRGAEYYRLRLRRGPRGEFTLWVSMINHRYQSNASRRK